MLALRERPVLLATPELALLLCGHSGADVEWLTHSTLACLLPHVPPQQRCHAAKLARLGVAWDFLVSVVLRRDAVRIPRFIDPWIQRVGGTR